MLGSIYSAMSGLSANQTFLNVTGNNIANVNTTGYKAQSVTFQDLLSQTVQGGTAPTATNGGVNPVQIGLGAQVGAISSSMTQGNLEQTGSPTDLAIQGDGYFVLSNGQGGQDYTRDGSFSIGPNGTLTNSSGLQVLGWAPNATTGLIDTAQPLQPVTIPNSDQMVGQASTQITFNGNLNQSTDATNPAANTVQTTVNVYDSLGDAHSVNITFTKTNNATNTWSWSASTTEPGVTVAGTGTLAFDPTTGTFTDTNGTAPDGALTLTTSNGATSPQTINMSFDGLTQVAAASSVSGPSDGLPPGSLTSFNIGTDGTITGVYSNGLQKTLGQVATASIPNPQGLMSQGGDIYTTSGNSGTPVIGAAGSGGRGQINSGYLEMSNVDLTQEFSNMIMAERGFQASSRVLTTSDEVLQEIVGMKPQ